MIYALDLGQRVERMRRALALGVERCSARYAKLHPRQPFFGARMPHRGQAHARRRGFVIFQPDEGTDNCVSVDFDDTTYDDVIPPRLRGTLLIDEHGEPAGLTDLVADRSLT